ncbi:MAG: phosphatase PAP2 family protein [Candidatus Aenigmatarchaeota archaeon]
MQAFWAAITALGDIRFWLLALLFIGVYASLEKRKLSRQAKRALRMLLFTFIAVALAVQALKMAVDAPRICMPCPGEACNPYCPADDPYAFPSGHAALSFAMFAAAWLALPKNARQRARLAWMFAIPVLVAASRVVLAVHTPGQVAAGAMLGIFVAALVWRRTKGINEDCSERI